MASFKLVEINNYTIPAPIKGNLTINRDDKYNEYETEDGNKKIEPIKLNIFNGSVTYGGLFAAQLQEIQRHLSLVSTMVLYNPFTGGYKEFEALITGITTTNIITENNAEAWSLSFNFSEVKD